MQNQFRKYYIDTYLDMQHKDEEDDYINSGANKAISNGSGNPRIMDSSEVEPQKNESNIIIIFYWFVNALKTSIDK